MDTGLRGKGAIVCAASRGLGRAAALALAAEGASLAICARDPDVLHGAAEEIRAVTGSPVVPLRADLSVSEDIRDLVEVAVAQLGGVDILVTNTGGPPSGAFESISDEAWLAATDSLLMSVVRLSREVIPHMRRRAGGRIINITSVSVKQPIEGLVLSNALRAAVTGLSKTLATELASDRITVNCVAPGYTATDRTVELAHQAADREGISPADVQRRTEERIPMRRMGAVDEFAAAVTFLASTRASYVTGVTLTVDGGFVRSLL